MSITTLVRKFGIVFTNCLLTENTWKHSTEPLSDQSRKIKPFLIQ